MTFKEKVYQITRQIPAGFVATYGQVARLAGKPKAGRAVGFFMKTNPDAPNTPCHRVVAANGSLCGYSGLGGLKSKKAMLRTEGVIFINDTVDLVKSRWDK